jgi:GTP-binding protein
MPGLVKKPVLVAANKMDEPNAPENLKAFKKKFKDPVHAISCVSDEGFAALKESLLEAVLGVRAAEQALEEAEEEEDY